MRSQLLPVNCGLSSLPEAVRWLACGVNKWVIWNIIWMLLLLGWWRGWGRTSYWWSRRVRVGLWRRVVNNFLRQVILVVLFIIALDAVVVVVVVCNEIAIVWINIATRLRLTLCDNVGTHVSSLNVHLFLLLFPLLVLLLLRLPQVSLVEVLMRCLRCFNDLIYRFFRA